MEGKSLTFPVLMIYEFAKVGKTPQKINEILKNPSLGHNNSFLTVLADSTKVKGLDSANDKTD